MKDLQIVVTFGPMTIAYLIAFFATLNTAFFIIAAKWGIIEKYEIHKLKWMPKKCEFCLFFWMCLIELVIAYFKLTTAPYSISEFCFLFAFAASGAVISRFLLGSYGE